MVWLFIRDGGSVFTMSTFVSNRGENLADLDIDELVERLTPGEIQKLLDEADPDDPQLPPALRCNYKCEKKDTGPFNKEALLKFIEEEALNTPDIPDIVPYVQGQKRGKVFTAPTRTKPVITNEELELDIDLGEDVELALSSATTDEIVDLAGIMGLHSMMNQDQYHASQSEKAPKPDNSVGLYGVTKSTPLKSFPQEAPNKTDPEEILVKVKSNDPNTKRVNLNNVPVQENIFIELFDALEKNDQLVELSLANTMLTDTAAAILASALATNKSLEKLNIESNSVSPQTVARMVESMGVHQTVTDFKASNQQAKFLGNKVEMAITRAVENNKTILKCGLHLQFGDCRNRVAVQLQKNLDRQRLRRVAHKLSTDTYPNGVNKGGSDGSYSDD